MWIGDKQLQHHLLLADHSLHSIGRGRQETAQGDHFHLRKILIGPLWETILCVLEQLSSLGVSLYYGARSGPSGILPASTRQASWSSEAANFRAPLKLHTPAQHFTSSFLTPPLSTHLRSSLSSELHIPPLNSQLLSEPSIAPLNEEHSTKLQKEKQPHISCAKRSSCAKKDYRTL